MPCPSFFQTCHVLRLYYAIPLVPNAVSPSLGRQDGPGAMKQCWHQTSSIPGLPLLLLLVKTGVSFLRSAYFSVTQIGTIALSI